MSGTVDVKKRPFYGSVTHLWVVFCFVFKEKYVESKFEIILKIILEIKEAVRNVTTSDNFALRQKHELLTQTVVFEKINIYLVTIYYDFASKKSIFFQYVNISTLKEDI